MYKMLDECSFYTLQKLQWTSPPAEILNFIGIKYAFSFKITKILFKR